VKLACRVLWSMDRLLLYSSEQYDGTYRVSLVDDSDDFPSPWMTRREHLVFWRARPEAVLSIWWGCTGQR